MEENKNSNLGKEKQSRLVEEEKNHHESKTNPVSMDGKLLVKLKFPKGAEETEEGAEVVVSPVKKSHFCHECNKGFSSGKALGGHMSSAHVQARENLKKLKFNMSVKFKRDGSSSDAAARETICSICGKDFPSRKSLFGHMRCHPDREWRGMEPPKEQGKIPREHPQSLSILDDDDEEEEEEEEEESLETDNQADYHVHVAADNVAISTVAEVVDLTRSLSSWSVKGKRGRECPRVLLDTYPYCEEEEQKIQDAVDQLISLAYKQNKHDGSSTRRGQIKEGRNSASGLKKKRVDDPVHPARVRRDYPVKKRRFSEIDTDSEETLDGLSDKGKRKNPMKPESSVEISPSSQSRHTVIGKISGRSNHFSAHELDKMELEKQNRCFYDDCKKGNVGVKNKRRGPKMTPKNSETEGELTPLDQKLDGEESTPEKFRCSTCDKTFSSHQALGGHRSSHNKFKATVQNTADGSSPFPFGHENRANPVSQTAVENDEIKGVEASKFPENIHECTLCKKTFPSGQALGGHKRCHWQGLSSQVASPEAEEPRPLARKGLQFDLNEPAEEEDANASDLGNSSGYASCS
ncbi:uncharacterized protein LOC113771788 [Coffea eugenioides]|uniref:uncharacterized protein LOC113771788 n=1 Tax=Coffea eugenioides TaxID=49369 RepID=UPI000F61557C|nr:uncharacterized protein LOC113771788 [Coffea eugenioides]